MEKRGGSEDHVFTGFSKFAIVMANTIMANGVVAKLAFIQTVPESRVYGAGTGRCQRCRFYEKALRLMRNSI
uniref:Uncharacterized protein n=1 Tax=Oryza sativa subsp. indica TaxID=39946 RepID=A0A679B8Z8_ORYSI|nr:hypothetical protein [Oryza sativa Indica Group]